MCYRLRLNLIFCSHPAAGMQLQPGKSLNPAQLIFRQQQLQHQQQQQQHQASSPQIKAVGKQQVQKLLITLVNLRDVGSLFKT